MESEAEQVEAEYRFRTETLFWGGEGWGGCGLGFLTVRELTYVSA